MTFILLPTVITLGVVLYGVIETVRLNKIANEIAGDLSVETLLCPLMWWNLALIGYSMLVTWVFGIIVTLLTWLLYFAFT